MSRPATNKRLIYVSKNELLINDLTSGDLLFHDYDLTDLLPSNTVRIHIGAQQVSGTGVFWVNPNSGAKGVSLGQDCISAKNVGIKNNKLQWALSVINDVFDVYLFGLDRELSMMQRDVR